MYHYIILYIFIYIYSQCHHQFVPRKYAFGSTTLYMSIDNQIFIEYIYIYIYIYNQSVVISLDTIKQSVSSRSQYDCVPYVYL